MTTCVRSLVQWVKCGIALLGSLRQHGFASVTDCVHNRMKAHMRSFEYYIYIFSIEEKAIVIHISPFFYTYIDHAYINLSGSTFIVYFTYYAFKTGQSTPIYFYFHTHTVVGKATN